MTKLKVALSLTALLLTIGLSSAAAHADTLNFTLTTPVESAGSGITHVLTYDATISAPIANAAAINLNGDSFSVTGPFSVDDTDFLVDFPLFLNPGGSFTGDLFTVTVPAGTASGTYTGSFTLLGGATGSSVDTLGTVSFTTAVTPEPSSLLLLGTGLVGMVATLRRKRGIKA